MIPRLDPPGDLTNREALVDVLSVAGLSSRESKSKAELFARSAAVLLKHGPRQAAELRAFFVPGPWGTVPAATGRPSSAALEPT